METSLTPRLAISAFLGGEHVDTAVLRAAVAQIVCAYDELVDLGSDVVDQPGNSIYLNSLAAELLQQQILLEEYYVHTPAVTALADLLRSRRGNKSPQVTR